ncbi:hypothetical protein FPZ54_13860 [Sphingomonas suaedae]|uniref:Uncharacterized protein n=1 Tax=Sphingomonas suaedae TaxID=2599297 RepID=A0A518RHQ6_9SPHN|nr:hypothetical protein [Sphingomonas suaedae]QDX26980.1 hypothetical protein FPZ54_13860 [Sphingomonas suaedae]
MRQLKQARPLVSLFLCALALGHGTASAQQGKPASPKEVSIEADLDLDGRPDRITAYLRPAQRMYWVHIKLSTGREFRPLSGYIDPRRARISLSYRGGQRGDIRCAEWRPTKFGASCGAGGTDAGPYRLIAFDTGPQMFLIYYTETNRHLDGSPPDHELAYFKVMSAIEGNMIEFAGN